VLNESQATGYDRFVATAFHPEANNRTWNGAKGNMRQNRIKKEERGEADYLEILG
jgi:hypothetical protein